MTKKLTYVTLGLMGLMGTLAIGVVNGYTPVDTSNYGTITISNPDNPSEGFTILDRNLGATTTGAGLGASEESYGYYYQWGNNNGNPLDPESSTALLQWDSSYSHNGYDGENNGFVDNGNRDIWSDDILHDDLWGGENDNADNYRGYNLDNYTDRQGPCPDNYHVPSAGEYSKLIEYRCGNNPEKCTVSNIQESDELHRAYDNDVQKYFMEDLNIPVAGFLSYEMHGSICGVSGSICSPNALLWSSSSEGILAHALSAHPGEGIITDVISPRISGYPVRCFKNEYVCPSGQHMQDEVCTDNTKYVSCSQSGVIPDNSHYDVQDVEVSRSEESGRSQPAECGFVCDEGYVGDSCGTKVIHYTDSNISYILNSGFTTQKLFTGVGTITVTDGDTTITILDRNLGATAVGTGCENSTMGTECMNGIEDDTYGYHFQWGNNHGFKPNFNNNTSFPGNEIAMNYDVANVDASGYGPRNYYSGSTFITDFGFSNNGDWSVNENDNLWGGSLTEMTDGKGGEVNIFDDSYKLGNDWKVDESTVTDRRGPCPEGFHVPSIGELAKLSSMFTDGLDMHKKLRIPFAGLRNYLDASVFNMGITATLWSSSPYSASNPNSRGLGLIVDGDLGQGGDGRALADSVRCFYDFYQPYTQSFTLSFMSGDVEVWSGEVESGSVYTDVPGENSVDPMPNMTKEGYDFDGWFLDGATEAFDFNEPITDNLVLHAHWTKKIYTIKWIDGNGNELKTDSVEYGDTPSYEGDTPTKTATAQYTYTFNNTWDPVIESVTDDATYTAQFDEVAIPKKSGGYSGGGGRRNKTSDTQDSSAMPQNDSNVSSGANAKDPGSVTPMDSSDKSSEGQYSDEFQQAYEFAYKNGITTMDTIQRADMEGSLTRIAMAKMLSQYAINVLGKSPANVVVPNFKDVTKELDEEYDNGVTLAYQLGIMGINMPNNKFRPFDYVTRAEFGTALSRLLFGTSDGEYEGTELYYVLHLIKLKLEGIVSNDDPNLQELRGYVMLMLMRSAM